MELLLGFVIIFIAGISQGTFILPSTLTKKWNWENTWFTFSIFSMLLINWILALIFIPHLFSVFQTVPQRDIILLLIFGFGWGVGAVLFGIGMDLLGMSLGYPIIQSLVAVMGAVIPMLIFNIHDVISLRVGILLLGAAIIVCGVIFCSRAHAMKEESDKDKPNTSKIGVLIAVGAGLLCCLPNVGASFGESTVNAALQFGASDSMAGNAVWAIFFTIGFIPNASYTIYLMKKNRSKKLFIINTSKYTIFGFFMALMWVGSMYVYGVGASMLGDWGLIIGWPLFISISIIVGNLWGVFQGEWANAIPLARRKLNIGLLIILLGMIFIGGSNAL